MTSSPLSQMDIDVRNCLLDEYNLIGSKVDLDLERKFYYRGTRIVFEKYIS